MRVPKMWMDVMHTHTCCWRSSRVLKASTDGICSCEVDVRRTASRAPPPDRIDESATVPLLWLCLRLVVVLVVVVVLVLPSLW